MYAHSTRTDGPADASMCQRFLSIDDALGPAERRYFGDGHRKVTQHLRDVQVRGGPSSAGHIGARASIHYPGDWSVKDTSSELRPHLSTIDAVVLAIGLGECHLAHACGLDQEQRGHAWVRSIQIRAGSAPQTDLADFEVEARVTDSRPIALSLCGYVTTWECRIGGLKARLEIEHEPGQATMSAGSFATAEDLLGNRAARYYADGYKRSLRTLNDVTVLPGSGGVTGLVTVAEPDPGVGMVGLGAAYRPSFSPIDAIVTAAQMAQALLYGLDDMERGGSNTLWMRRIAFALPTPYQPIANAFVASVSTDTCRVTPMGGALWRTADLRAEILGGTGSFSVTHALPPEPST